MDKAIEFLAWLYKHAEELPGLVSDLERHGDLAKAEQEKKHNIDRLRFEEQRLINSYKTQARSELVAEADVIREKAVDDAAKMMSERQRELDAVDAEIRLKQARLNQIVGDIERGEAKLAEFHRVRQSLLAR
jgi:hypothetical protein